jgi:hypothetical protein
VCDLEDAFKRGFLSQRLHHTKLSHVLCLADLTEPLKQLVAQSALSSRPTARTTASSGRRNSPRLRPFFRTLRTAST